MGTSLSVHVAPSYGVEQTFYMICTYWHQGKGILKGLAIRKRDDVPT